MRRWKKTLSLGLVPIFWAGSASGPASGLGQEAQLSVGVELVVVPVTVKDADGRLVQDLDEEDFVVEEDGERQTIEQFSMEPTPLSTVIMVDSGVSSESLAAVQKSAPVLAEILGEDDEVALFRYDNQVFQMQDFTTDKDVLLKALARLEDLNPTIQTRGGRAPVDSPVVNGVPLIPTAPEPITQDKRVLHDAIAEATRALRGRPDDRRRVILLISDGSERDSDITFQDNAFALMETEAQIFAVALNIGFFTDVVTTLDNYAGVSGGEFYRVDTRQLEPTILRIGQQARNQYVLGYYSTNQAPPDRVLFRRIDVDVDGPYLIVHKDGYYQVP
jgi:VWFA-related protein